MLSIGPAGQQQAAHRLLSVVPSYLNQESRKNKVALNNRYMNSTSTKFAAEVKRNTI